ncbi:MAG: hypothetical protein HY706_06295 [Candidatus Hydrogenedentes bacterium]|nr:hypothetical protein [Candidatus Hydrogenedentota bacterium]
MTMVFIVSMALVATSDETDDPGVIGMEAFRTVFLPGSASKSDSLRASRYIERFDREVDELAKTFNFRKGLLDLSGPMPPPEVADWEPEARKKYAEDGNYRWLYKLGRGSASAIGAFGLAWALPESRHHGDEKLRQGVIHGLEAFLNHQAPSGEFVLSSIRFASCYGTHEMAWRLEPLLAAYLCVAHTLPPDQAKRFHEGLQRAADYLYRTPCDSQTNRGCVWCGVMAVSAKMFDRPDYLDRVRTVWTWVDRRVFQESGQVLEGPGPDFVYSYVSFLYTFLRRLATGNRDLDIPLIRSLDWLITMHDGQGLPMQAVSTRLSNYGPTRLSYLVAALEYYARQRPYYATVVSEYLDILEREDEPVATGHGGMLWLAAAMYHDSGIAPEPLPDRLCRFTSIYLFDVTRYLNVRRDYHTLALFSGVKDLAGLQHWSLAGERPILFEYPDGASGIQAWGLDTARIKLEDASCTDSSDLETASADWGGIRTCYVFGESATWVINVAPSIRRELRWAINAERCAVPVLNGNTVSSEGQKSRIDLGPVTPSLAKLGAGWQVRASLTEKHDVDWTIFHDGRAGITGTRREDGILTAELSDGSGHYDLHFNAGDGFTAVSGARLAPLHARVIRLKSD